MDVPPGFRHLQRSSPLLDLVGPLYSRGEGAELVLGLRIAPKHCNSLGRVHGGIFATLADAAMGFATAFSATPTSVMVTANLSLDFAGGAGIGDWLEAHVSVQKHGQRLAFANCYISTGDERIVRASAVFLVTGALDPGPPP